MADFAPTIKIIVIQPPRFKSYPMIGLIGLVLVAMVSIQCGAALAKRLFPVLGASGTTALRLTLGALLLVVVWRPWRLRATRSEWRTIVAYGVAMGLMNFWFYSALSHIPLGIAVALEFTGPLTVAMLASRRPLDFVWIAMAALGLIALLPINGLSQPLSPVGVAFALGAGICWALYIVFGQKAGNAHGGQIAALGLLIGAVVIVPIGAMHAGWQLLSPAVLPIGLAVAVLSSALPYSLEMLALARMPTRTFGVLMSLEPAVGSLSGLAFLGEHLSALQWTAVACVVAASAGSAATSQGPAAAPA